MKFRAVSALLFREASVAGGGAPDTVVLTVPKWRGQATAGSAFLLVSSRGGRSLACLGGAWVGVDRAVLCTQSLLSTSCLWQEGGRGWRNRALGTAARNTAATGRGPAWRAATTRAPAANARLQWPASGDGNASETLKVAVGWNVDEWR